MKLASLKHGRDGRLVVVSRDLERATDASAVAPTLQAALDDWGAAEPRLTEIASSCPALVETMRCMSENVSIVDPSMAVTISPARKPPFSAGLPTSTESTIGLTFGLP